MIKEFLSNIIDSFNPNAYTFLSGRDLRSSFKFFTYIVLIFSIANFLIFLPQIISFYSSFNENMDKLESVDMTINIKTNEELKISDKPLVVIDSERNSTNKERVLITGDRLYWKGLFGYKEYSLTGFDFVQFIKSSQSKLVILMILSLPTIFLFYFISNLLKTFLLVFLSAFVIYSILRIRDRPITFKQVRNICIYSLSMLLAFKLLLWFNFVIKFWIPLALYFLWITIIVFLLDDSRLAFVQDPMANQAAPAPRGKSKKRTIEYQDINANNAEMEKINDLLKHKRRR